MTYEQRKDWQPEDGQGACGVPPQTCAQRLQVLRERGQRHMTPGRPPKLALEPQLGLPRPDGRAARPSVPMGLAWGVTASGVCRTGHRVATRLLQSPGLHGPGTQPWRPGGPPLAVLGVAGAERPVERPPKTSGALRAGSSNATPRQPHASSRLSPASASVSRSGRAGSTRANGASGASAPERQRSRGAQTTVTTGASRDLATAPLRRSSDAVQRGARRSNTRLGAARAAALSASPSEGNGPYAASLASRIATAGSDAADDSTYWQVSTPET